MVPSRVRVQHIDGQDNKADIARGGLSLSMMALTIIIVHSLYVLVFHLCD